MSSPMEHFSWGGCGQNAAVGTTAEQLTAASVKCKRVQLKASPGNTGIIYFGKASDVDASTGYPLEAGAESAWLDVKDLQDVYVVASVNGEDVAYVYDV